MGLGTKIKEALHGDNHADHAEHTSSSVNAPGAYPSDEVPQRHSDGKEYVAPHGSLIGHKDKTGHTTGNTAGTTSGLGTSGSQHNKLHKGVDEYDPAYEGGSKLSSTHRTQDSGVGLDQSTHKTHSPTSKGGAYWGDLSHGGQGSGPRDLSDRSRLDNDTTGATGRHHGGHHDRHTADQAVGGGYYNAQAGPGGATRDVPDRSRLDDDLPGTTGQHHQGGHHDRHLAGQPAGGGVYNSVSGTGGPEHTGARTGQSHGAVHDPLSSGTKGVPVSSGNTYDPQTDLRGEGVPSSRNDHHTGHGLAGVGAGAAAGYGAHEISQHHRQGNNSGYDHTQQPSTSGTHAAGVPRSSMLDPEPGLTGSSSQPGYNNAPTHPAGQFSGGPSNISPSNTNTGAGFGSPSHSSAPGAASGGKGGTQFGPGHEGSKVLHTCQHCGRDNDISQYFSKDVVYRLGQ